MMNVLCAKCQREFKSVRSGVMVVELYRGDSGIYRAWYADLLECPCGQQVVSRFADKPIAKHDASSNFLKKLIERHKAEGALYYWKERPL